MLKNRLKMAYIYSTPYQKNTENEATLLSVAEKNIFGNSEPDIHNPSIVIRIFNARD